MLNNYHFFGRSQDLTEKYTGMQQENSTERVEKAQDCTIGLGGRGMDQDGARLRVSPFLLWPCKGGEKLKDDVEIPLRTPVEIMELLKEKSRQVEQEQDRQKAKEPAPVFLPGLEEAMRAMPNAINRSSLFAPVARGRKKYHDKTVLVSRSDAVLEYWGLQLNELHADVVLQLLFEARNFPLGMQVHINRNRFLGSLGWGNSGTEYKRFHRYMEDLTAAMLVIESKHPDGRSKYKIGRAESFRIVEKFRCDENGENYSYILDPRWVMMFGNREYALLDWAKRLQISQGQDLAKALQRLFATSDESPQRYALDWLQEKMQYSGRLRDFKVALDRSLKELKRLEIMNRWGIAQSSKGNEQLSAWTKK